MLGGLMTAGAIAGGASIAGGIMGMISSSSDKAKAAAAIQSAQDQINALGLTADQAGPVYIQKLQSAGVWDPAMEKTISAGVSQVSQIQEDPALRAKQMASLNALQQIASTGESATGKAALNADRAKVQQDANSRNAAILQKMQQQGMAGSGSTLAQQLSNSQGAANSESASADQVAAQQEQAKMAAISQLGQQSGQVRGQDFSNNQVKAGAADAFKMFDVNNQVAQQARNVGATNQAAQYNTMNNQALMNANTNNANTEALREKAGAQTDFQDAEGLAQLKANTALGAATQSTTQANNTQQGYQNIGTGVGSSFGTIAGIMNKKKPTTDDDDGGEAYNSGVVDGGG